MVFMFFNIVYIISLYMHTFKSFIYIMLLFKIIL